MNTLTVHNPQILATGFDAHTLMQQTFPELNRHEIEILSHATTCHAYEAGTDLCVEGEIGTKLFVIAQGEAAVIVNVGSRNQVQVDMITTGEYFGEMAFFGEQVRLATIRARTAVNTLEIDYDDFMEIGTQNTGLLQTFLRQVISRVRSHDQTIIDQLNDKNVALQRTYAELAEQEDLREQFIATLSHELRTPLTSIQGYLGLINQGAIKGGNALNVAMDSITRNVDKMVGLTNNLLILYEIHPGTSEYAYLRLTDVIVEALNEVRETGVVDLTAVNLDISPDIPKVYADQHNLVIAVRALLENAYKFTANKPVIDVRVYQANNSEVAIEIMDQGIGIPEEEQENIFQPFYRLEEEGTSHLFPGLGVGLTITQFIVERHNGRITLKSAPNQETTITLFLPTSK